MTRQDQIVTDAMAEKFYNQVQEDGEYFDIDHCRELLQQFVDELLRKKCS
jgi:hypothetical protein